MQYILPQNILVTNQITCKCWLLSWLFQGAGWRYEVSNTCVIYTVYFALEAILDDNTTVMKEVYF